MTYKAIYTDGTIAVQEVRTHFMPQEGHVLHFEARKYGVLEVRHVHRRNPDKPNEWIYERSVVVVKEIK